jgi:cyclic-di-GMP-binding protein
VADPSFDVVSKVDRQEVDNALNQAGKELATRFDFRGTGAQVSWAGDAAIAIQAETEERCRAAIEVFREKLVKRSISLKAFDVGDPAPSGKVYKVTGTIVQGIASDKAKQIAKKIRDEGPKGVQAQIQGDQVRVTGKKKDHLQDVIALLKGSDFGIALQFTNYR